MSILKKIGHGIVYCSLAAWTLTMFTPHQAAASTFSVDVDLHPELQRAGIDPASVKVAGVVVTNTDTGWEKTLHTNVLSQMFSISAVPGGARSSVPHGIKIDYNPIRMIPVEVSSCTSAMGVCAELEVSGTPEQVSFTLDQNTYTLNLYGVPCSDGFACEFYVSSWQLHRIVEEAAGRPGGIPKIVAVLDLSDKILLLDAERKSTWLSISKQAINAIETLGTVRTVRADEDGRFVVTYEHGLVMVDLIKDALFFMSYDGLYVSSRALAGMQQGDYDSLVSLPNHAEEQSKALFLSGNTVVWSSYYATVADLQVLKPSDIKDLPEPFAVVAWSKGQVRGLSAPEGQVRLWHLIGNDFKDAGRFARQHSMRYYRLAGDGVFFVSGQNTKILKTDGTAPTSLDHGFAILLPAGGAVVRRETRDSCAFAHMFQNNDAASAFKDSGIYIPCSEYRGVSQGTTAAVLFGISGATLKIRGITYSPN